MRRRDARSRRRAAGNARSARHALWRRASSCACEAVAAREAAKRWSAP
ncbi:hypothetical protein C7S16_2435 [Burkholderia thailandensis]|uniref:Uncharacterized protein n=1 Tax=Burkholderia thailandensis TaxID=57975 RepID=A0AAW9D5Q8_BURTH|nr:hypothetical protein [Burkholderia thailandensis]MDW9257098.1 hypothetical protein [Burkholderia thailandensis]